MSQTTTLTTTRPMMSYSKSCVKSYASYIFLCLIVSVLVDLIVHVKALLTHAMPMCPFCWRPPKMNSLNEACVAPFAMLWGVPLVMFVSHTTSHHANVWYFMLQALLCHFYNIKGCSTKLWLHHIHYMASHKVSIYARLWFVARKPRRSLFWRLPISLVHGPR